VNDYVVRDDEGAMAVASDSDMATDDPSSGSGSGSDTESGTDVTSADETSGGTIPDPDSGTPGTGDPSTGGVGDTGVPQFTCEPCTADDQCGDDFDHCVDLGDAGPRCVFSCPEAGCPPDLDCAATTSLDGAMSVQCVPVAPMC
jgi:hypothetical protein